MVIRGCFVVFEGGEGCGKSTQSEALYKHLLRTNRPVDLLREPGSTPLGNKLRGCLKQKNGVNISPIAELFLFAASRAQVISEIICPSLEQGHLVICDRYIYSTIAYQGYGRGLDLHIISQVNSIAVEGLLPDLVILLDISPELGLARKYAACEADRFEMEEVAFHHRVRQGYLELASGDPNRWLIIDATKSKKEIELEICQRVEEVLSQTGDNRAPFTKL